MLSNDRAFDLPSPATDVHKVVRPLSQATKQSDQIRDKHRHVPQHPIETFCRPRKVYQIELHAV